MNLLLDNNLAPRIAKALNVLFEREHQIIALRDWFAADTPDVDWITALDRQGGWAVLTRDLHILTRPHERALLDRVRIVFFIPRRRLGQIRGRGNSGASHSPDSEDGNTNRTCRARAFRIANQRRLEIEATPALKHDVRQQLPPP